MILITHPDKGYALKRSMVSRTHTALILDAKWRAAAEPLLINTDLRPSQRRERVHKTSLKVVGLRPDTLPDIPISGKRHALQSKAMILNPKCYAEEPLGT